MKEIMLIGFGGHARGVIDSIEAAGEYHITGFLETPNRQELSYRNYKVVGTDEDMKKYYDAGIRHAFITVGFMGNSPLRRRLYKALKETGYILPVITDKSAAIAADVWLAEGCYVGKNAIVNANASVGKMCIINSGAIVEHDCMVGDFSHVAVGAVLCGEAAVGNDSLIGANATVLQGVSIGNHSIVGAGSIITRAVEHNCVIHNKVSMSYQLRKGS